MKRLLIFFMCLTLLFALGTGVADAKKKSGKPGEKKDKLSSGTFSGLKLRTIGPAFTSGRISDFAVNPNDPSEYYVGVAAGNVWKTNNSGTTWKPIFDKYGSWSIADVEIDPNNTSVVWVGTGEYNSQRAIGYGDGVYRSEDGGKSFKNVGLKKSEHIGRIVIDPRNSHVYVAAQGPLWGPGGERGLYKTTDNGKTWKLILQFSKDTGVTDIVMDPRNPDVLYAASYQRRRRVWTLVNGGPEGGIHKSVDAGKTWTKLKSGLPSGDVGRIGLAISPVNPDIIFAIVEAQGKKGGVFRSTNRGASWAKRSSYVSRSPQYYNRIVADPKNVDILYSLDTRSKVSVDGGKTWNNLSNKNRHVDDHALWIDPKDNRHLLIGGDGGVYESFNSGKNWLFKCNLPITQFYRVSVDNSLPFYYVYGGTQDNNSMGGPSQTLSGDGIVNSDWFITNGGDGFKSQVDPKDPNIIYAQAQYGYIVRYDRKSGESTGIKPQEGKGEAYRWNWNAPLIISPHSHTRLYFGANILFRSDDRGNTWKKVSGDLSRQIDRDKLKIMGKIQKDDAVAKNASTSLFGNLVSLTESELKEGLIYVGTDDGLIQVTEDGGKNWRKIDSVPGVPKMTYVSCLYACQHDEGTVFASFDGRKDSNLKPYLFKSTDKGKTWANITANLPERGTVYTICQDHVKKDLLFAGTEFGLFVTIDGGKKWIQLKSGLPTTAVRDIVIQERENDLAIATFGRGFYILDNYTPLRQVTKAQLDKASTLFPVKKALLYIQGRKRYGQGDTFYKAPNPPFGATFTYYLKEVPKSLKQERKAAEKKAEKAKKPFDYPTMAQLKAEDNEGKPYLVFTIKDSAGQVVRRLRAAAAPGIHRITWDLKYVQTLEANEPKNPFKNDDGYSLALPGKYSVSWGLYNNGKLTPLDGPQSFDVEFLGNATLPAKDRKAVLEFQNKVSALARAAIGTRKYVDNLFKRLKLIKEAIFLAPNAPHELTAKVEALEKKLKEIKVKLTGDRSISKRNANQTPAIISRIYTILYVQYRSTSTTTTTQKEQYNVAAELFEPILGELKQLVEKDLKELENALESAGAPWTPGRFPTWKK